MQPILYVFDIDGTLTDSVQIYHQVITEAMRAVGIPDIDTNFDDYLHHTDSYALEYNFEKCFRRRPAIELRDKLDEALAIGMRNFPKIQEIQGARELLLSLKAKNIPIAFGTGAFPKATHIKMTDAGLAYQPDVLATSKTSISRAGFVTQAIAQAKRYYKIDHFERIIAVGDGLWDLQTAQELDLEFIGVGKAKKETLLANGCPLWVEDLRDFPTIQ